MQFQKVKNSYIVHVEKGEKVIESLTLFCKQNNIYSAQIAGIGAVKNIDIGAYDIDTKEHTEEKMNCDGTQPILFDEDANEDF